MCSSSTGTAERATPPSSLPEPTGSSRSLLAASRGAADGPLVRSHSRYSVTKSSLPSAPSRPVWWSTPPWAGEATAIALLAAHPGLRIIGLDRDAVALEAAAERLAPFGDRVSLVHAPFSALGEATPERGRSRVRISDLGMSSPQLDQADRGFSFRADAAIDMRMDQSTGSTAAQLVNELPEAALAALFRENGEGRLAGGSPTPWSAPAPPHVDDPAQRTSWPPPSRPRSGAGSHPAKRGSSRPCGSQVNATRWGSWGPPSRSPWSVWRSAVVVRSSATTPAKTDSTIDRSFP